MVLTKDYVKWQKIPCIPPILHNNKFVTDFSKKASLFNSVFAKQCSIIENNSGLPSLINLITNWYLANIEFTKDDIKRITCNLDPNEAHGHGMISIHMLRMSGDAMIEPLLQIFKNCIKRGIFPDDWKKDKLYQFLKRWQKKHQKLSPSLSSSNLQQDFWMYHIW